MKLHFLRATENDISRITALAHRIWQAHYPDVISVEQIDYMLRTRYSAAAITTQMQAGEQFFLACDGSSDIGYASVQGNEEGWWLHKFYVDVSLHRQGVGRQFLLFLLREIAVGKPVRLQVNRQNFKAINFYFKHGFVIERVADFDIGNGYFMNDFVMVRP